MEKYEIFLYSIVIICIIVPGSVISYPFFAPTKIYETTGIIIDITSDETSQYNTLHLLENRRYRFYGDIFTPEMVGQIVTFEYESNGFFERTVVNFKEVIP
jgi:hypothetical protein